MLSPPPKELAMEKHQGVISLGMAKWKLVIIPYRQCNENVSLSQNIDEWKAGVKDQVICRQHEVI